MVVETIKKHKDFSSSAPQYVEAYKVRVKQADVLSRVGACCIIALVCNQPLIVSTSQLLVQQLMAACRQLTTCLMSPQPAHCPPGTPCADGC